MKDVAKDEAARRARENIAGTDRTRSQAAKPDLDMQRKQNAQWRQAAEARHARQVAALVERQDLKSRALETANRPGADQTRGLDLSVVAREAERERLDAANRVARDRLAAVDRTERLVLQEQWDRVNQLASRQQKEVAASRDASPDARAAMEDRHQREATLLAERARAEIRALDEHRSLTNAQIAREAAQFETAMYREAAPEERASEQSSAVDRQQTAHQDLELRARAQLSEVRAHFERAQERLASDSLQARFGDLRRYADQDRSIREEGVRKSEHEHIRARINLVLQTIDPVDGRSAYDKAAYRRSATLTIPRDMAVEKTREDLALRDRLKDALAKGVFTAELIRDMAVQADIQRTIEARDRTIDARLAEGGDVADLRAITDDAIARAAHYQQSELFEVGDEQRSPIADASAGEVEAAVDRWREEG